MITIEEILNNKVLSLSWKQPYLFLMPPPYNKIETRTWPTKVRGLVLMCASAMSYKQQQILNISGGEQYERINDAVNGNEEQIHKYGRGKALYIGRLIDCHPMLKSEEDKCFVEYHPELFSHVYEDVTAIEPLPWKGGMKWSIVPDEFKNRITIKNSLNSEEVPAGGWRV